MQEIWEISALLKFSYGVKFTRVDLRIDDYSKQLNPDLMLKAFQDGNYANFRTLDKIQPPQSRMVGSRLRWTVRGKSSL